MATKLQAQVKMTPKPNPIPRRDAVPVATTLDADVAVQRQAPSPGRAFAPIKNSPPAENEARFASRPAARSSAVWYDASKRIFDLVLGFVLLVIATPIILIAALAIRLETKGSPFFVQTRLGKNGKPFKIVKLRGMYIDARTRFSEYYDFSTKRDLNFCFHHETDPRVTRAGRFIRRTSVDELPNLLNVVLGDMSLVGPRPEIPEVLALYGIYRDEYISVKPGVTCLSKCTGRDRLTKYETIEYDLKYIRNRNFTFDFSILWKTFRGVVLRRDVF